MGTIKCFISFVGGFGILLLIAMATCFTLGALLWPYTINTWLIYADKPPVIEWWMGGLMGLVPACCFHYIHRYVVYWLRNA